MNTIDRSQLIDAIYKQRQNLRAELTATRNLPAPIAPTQREFSFNTQDDVRSSQTVLEGLAAAQPKLVSESLDTLERGFRRTQVYRQSDGRDFIRNEEVILTDKGLKRTVTQQNPSGSNVTFEENLDRQSDGAFRRTVRYTDEIGATQTKIEASNAGIDPFILSGGTYNKPASPYDQRRGVYLDVSA